MRIAVQDILRIEQEMVREFNAGRIARLLKHFHPRIAGFSSTRQERIAGKAAIRKTFDYYRQASSHMKYQIARPKVQVFDDTAVATFYWAVELGRRPRHIIHGRGTHVFVEQRGRWWIVHEHFSRAH